MNYTEFAQTIRSKYPGAYDNVDDKTLATRVVEKYPVYKDSVTFDLGQTQQESPSMIQKMTNAYQSFKKSPMYQYSIPGMSEKGMGLANRGFNFLGEKTATGLASKGVNPLVSAGIGTAVQMAPDIALTAIAPSEGVSKELPGAAVALERRALGFQKSLLKTPFARGKAAEAAKVALEENIVPTFGSPQTALTRAQGLQGKTGYQIGKMRESVGAQPLDEIKSGLEELRNVETQGARGGTWDTIHSKIDKALEGLRGIEETVAGKIETSSTKIIKQLSSIQKEPISSMQRISGKSEQLRIDPFTGLHKYTPEIPEIIVQKGGTIEGLVPKKTIPYQLQKSDVVIQGGGKPVSFTGIEEPVKVDLRKVERLKKEIADSVNWINDNATQSLSKKISMKIEKGVERILGKEGVDLNKYKDLKRTYSASKLMQKGLNNEVAGQQGNMGISLPSMVMGAGQNIPSSISRMALTEFLKRRGAGIGAGQIKNLAQARNPSKLLLESIAALRKKK